MILADSALRERLETGRLVVRPLFVGAVQPASIDLHLGPKIKIDTPDGFREHDLAVDGPHWLGPLDFVLGATFEHVEIPSDLVGILVGKSSRAREGIQVVSDAGYVDPGWRGELTLEITKFGRRPVALSHGMPIAQLRISLVSGEVACPYTGHYQDSAGPVESRATLTRPVP